MASVERLNPAVDLDFITGRYVVNRRLYPSLMAVPGIAYTSTGNGSAQWVDGSWTKFATNAPRVTDRGLLAEESRTNLVAYSQDQAGSWTRNNVGRSAGQIDPNGGTTARDYSNTVNLGSFFQAQTATALANGTTYTRTVLAKAVSGTGVLALEYYTGTAQGNATFNLLTGVATGAGSNIVAHPNGWFACSVTFTTAATGTPVGAVIYVGAYGSTATATTIRVWQADVQLGPSATSPTSPIVTNGAAIARSADSMTMTGLGAMLGNQPHTLLVEFGSMTTTVNQVYLTANATQSPGNSYSGLRFNGGSFVCPVRENGTGIGQDDVSGPSVSVATSVNKFALRRRLYENSASINGQPVTTKVTALNPALAHLCIGHFSGSSWCNTYIRRVRILMGDLTDAQLRALTAA